MTGLTRKPRVGNRLTYEGKVWGTVHHFDGNLCFVTRQGQEKPGPADLFIWRFTPGGGPEEFNTLFTIIEDSGIQR